MAVINTSGEVDFIKYGDDFGLVQIRDPETNQSELFFIWSGSLALGPSGLFSMQLALALTRHLRVEIRHEEDSPFMLALMVFAPEAADLSVQ